MPALLRLMLTCTFLSVGAYCLARCGYFSWTSRRHPASAWTTEAAHLLMSAAMVGMIWWGGGWDRWGIQLTAFALFAGWFAVRAFVGPAAGPRWGAGATRPALLYEAVAFGTMCWMLRPAASGGAALTGQAMAMSTTASPSSGTQSTVTIALAAALLVGASGWGGQLRRVVGRAASGDRPTVVAVFGPAGEAACQIVMAAGMAVAVLAVR